jgi:hypothetical protein
VIINQRGGAVTREEHLRAIYIVGSAKRGKRNGLRMLCSGPDCGGAEMFAIGLTAASVVTAVDAHIEEIEEGP